VRIRVAWRDSLFEILARIAASVATGARVILSVVPDVGHQALGELEELASNKALKIKIIEESDADLAAHIAGYPPPATERIRYAAPERVPEMVRLAAAKAGVYLADEPVLAEGRIELLWYLHEQGISYDYHRYGNLGARAGEKRADPV
jgi:RHH-type transcriptional regulator, proline utilization regulon repressor / proline dehydrogenase / delta 1-pyrroline-5-carboxylate dehydrogenase